MSDALTTITEALGKLTPGKWKATLGDYETDLGEPYQYESAGIDSETDEGPFSVDCGDFYGLRNEDAEGIVAIVNALPALLEDYRRLQAQPCVTICRENRAAGRGPCGACALCCAETFGRAETAEQRLVHVLAERDALRERWDGLTAFVARDPSWAAVAARMAELEARDVD